MYSTVETLTTSGEGGGGGVWLKHPDHSPNLSGCADSRNGNQTESKFHLSADCHLLFVVCDSETSSLRNRK